MSLTCPFCEKGPYKDLRGLNSHKRSAHGILGSSPSAVEKRIKQGDAEVVWRQPGQRPVTRADLVQLRRDLIDVICENTVEILAALKRRK